MTTFGQYNFFIATMYILAVFVATQCCILDAITALVCIFDNLLAVVAFVGFDVSFMLLLLNHYRCWIVVVVAVALSILVAVVFDCGDAFDFRDVVVLLLVLVVLVVVLVAFVVVFVVTLVFVIVRVLKPLCVWLSFSHTLRVFGKPA